MSRRVVTLDTVRILVADEGDRMLTTGLPPRARPIVNQTRADRQTPLLSTLEGRSRRRG